MTSELTFLYVHGDQIGYARAGTLIAEQLEKRGVTIYDDDGYSHEKAGAATRKVTDGSHAPPSPTNAISWISVPTHAKGWYQGQHRSILTMWEAMSLPESFRETIHEFDLIMVPSPHNLELFSKFHDNVQLILLGIDPAVWYYTPPPPVHTFFDFLIAGRGERKGIDLAYEAFQTVFGHWWTFDDDNVPSYQGPTDQPIPRLVMKSLLGHGQYYAPGIKHVTGRLSQDAERDLYASCHAYIQPSRGEGFGLQPLQAIAMGRPTILTNAHGHESYAHLGIGLSSKPAPASYFIYGEAGEWWEPDFDELCEAMWDVYTNYESHAEAARFASRIATNDFTWERTADRFMELMADPMSQPYTGSGEWEETTRKLYRIVTIEDHKSHAAGTFRYFEKGKEYWDLADIKRILFDAGKLDPSCLQGDDLGLAPDQLVGLDEYNAARSYCPHCGQRYNTVPTRADDILNGVEGKYLLTPELAAQITSLR